MLFINKKKNYFKKKLEGVQKMIWDFEFKREKTSAIREEVRKEYDGSKARLDIIEAKIKSFPEEISKWTDEQKGYNDQKVLLERDIERYISQMKKMDLDITGAAPTNEMPDGYEGINNQLESLRELQGMIKSYLKNIC